MDIEIISHSNLHNTNKIDSSFIVDSKLRLSFSDNQFTYETEPVIPYVKKYEYEHPDYSLYIDSDTGTVFFALESNNLAGEIFIVKRWNRYAYINDFAVKQEYRRKGIGKALLSKAIEWAKEKNCIGIEAETQDVNVKACLFYERNGFVLGGVNSYLYKSSEKEKDEIALNWYLLF